MRHRKAVTIVGLTVFAILAAGSMDTDEKKEKEKEKEKQEVSVEAKKPAEPAAEIVVEDPVYEFSDAITASDQEKLRQAIANWVEFYRSSAHSDMVEAQIRGKQAEVVVPVYSFDIIPGTRFVTITSSTGADIKCYLDLNIEQPSTVDFASINMTDPPAYEVALLRLLERGKRLCNSMSNWTGMTNYPELGYISCESTEKHFFLLTNPSVTTQADTPDEARRVLLER